MGIQNLVEANQALSTCSGWSNEKRECVTKFNLEFVGSSGRVFVRDQQTDTYYKLDGLRGIDSKHESDIYNLIKNTRFASRFSTVKKVADGILECEYIDGVPLPDCEEPMRTKIRDEISALQVKVRRLYGISIIDLGGDNVRVMPDGTWKIVDYGYAFFTWRGFLFVKIKKWLNNLKTYDLNILKNRLTIGNFCDILQLKLEII